MSTLRYFLVGTVCLFALIGFLGRLKQRSVGPVVQTRIEEIPLNIAPLEERPQQVAQPTAPLVEKPLLQDKQEPLVAMENLPDTNRIEKLFVLDSSKLPIVETVSYTSRVPWLQDRPAWLADYASHYATSRHFIARSLNRKVDYLTQKVFPGDRFNVLKKEKNLSFHLLVDLSRCRMWFYYFDGDTKERVLLRTYLVGVGRKDHHRFSGCLTPVGKFSLGEKIAIYKPGVTGHFAQQKVEMIRVFGTRWIPFDKELEGCSESARGFGLHGAPWMEDESGQLKEDLSRIGKYDSDGCIRLAAGDIEEIFSIVITKPTVVEIVKDFQEAHLPGWESKGDSP